MPSPRRSMRTKIKRTTLFFILTAGGTISLFITGCAQNTGRLYVDGEVTQIFETYTVLPDHRYYYHGPANHPQAVMGLQKDYTLKPGDLWNPIELTPEKLRQWLNFPSPRVGYDHFRRGRYILDPDGGRLGIWYPVQDGNDLVFISVEADNQVVVGAPVQTNRGRSRFKKFGPPTDD